MPAADRKPVSVAASHQHEELRMCELDALSDWQRAAVDAVEAVRGRVTRNAAGAPDPRDERDLVRRPADGRERVIDRLDDPEVTAARAPDRLQIALVILRLIDAATHCSLPE